MVQKKDTTVPVEVAGGTQQARGEWGGQVEFILSCVGAAVGLGNVWRFPYLTYQNGGGAFLLPFLIMLFLVGLPIFYFELCFGQFASLGPISIWRISPILRGIGFAMVAVNWILGLYYVIIVAWAFYFLFASFAAKVPWSDCEEWTSSRCITIPELKMLRLNKTLLNETLAERNLTHIENFTTPSEEYFYNKVLEITPGMEQLGSVRWELALCLLLSWVIIYLVLIRGIQSLGKVVYFASTFPYLMLTILVVRGATLPGAGNGVEYYLKPIPSKLGDPLVWVDAATMVFYALSTCSGGLIALSSYNKFHNNCFRDSLIVPGVTAFTSLYSGFAIFTVLGFMAHEKGVDVPDVAAQGPGLVFVVYPEALSQMPLPPLWSVLFFIMLITLGFSSLFTIIESVFVAVIDEFPEILRANKYRPIIFRGVCISIYYLITLPMVTQTLAIPRSLSKATVNTIEQGGFYLFNLTDQFLGGFPLLFVGLTEIFAVIYVYGYNRFADDIELMLGRKPFIFYKICWLVVTPLIIFISIIVKAVIYKPLVFEGYVYPPVGQALGWLIVAFILMWIPLVFFVVLWRAGQLTSVVKRMIKPDPSWGPANPQDRVGTRYAESLDVPSSPDGLLSASPSQLHGSSAPTTPQGIIEPPSYIETLGGRQDYVNPAYIDYKF